MTAHTQTLCACVCVGGFHPGHQAATRRADSSLHPFLNLAHYIPWSTVCGPKPSVDCSHIEAHLTQERPAEGTARTDWLPRESQAQPSMGEKGCGRLWCKHSKLVPVLGAAGNHRWLLPWPVCNPAPWPTVATPQAQLLTIGQSGSCPPSLPPADHAHGPGSVVVSAAALGRSNTSPRNSLDRTALLQGRRRGF